MPEPRRKFRRLFRNPDGTPDYKTTTKWYATTYGISVTHFYKMIGVESGWRPLGCNYAGACGIAQIIPRYHPGVNVFDPLDSLDYSAWYYRQNLLAHGGSWAKALTIYNAGAGNLARALSRGGEARWQLYLPAETQKYIRLIIGRFPGEYIDRVQPIDPQRWDRIGGPMPAPPPAPPPPPPPAPPAIPKVDVSKVSTILNDLAWDLWRIKGKFGETAGAVEGVYLVGRYLAAPFRFFEQNFSFAAQNVWKFKDALADGVARLNQILDGSILPDLLSPIIRDIQTFMRDPGAWVFAHIRYVWRGWDDFIRDPARWLRETVKSLWPRVDDILGDFDEAVIAAVTRRSTELRELMSDPRAWLRARVKELLRVEDDFFRDPAGYLSTRVLDALWDFLERNAERVAATAERILVKLWE